MGSSGVIQSVNWHLTPACNYACKFCFAQNLGEKPIPEEQGVHLIERLVNLGMDKINFAGGEPLLHPGLANYCSMAKDFGMTVSITTNGSLLTTDLIDELKEHVDWIAISVDSAIEETETKLGRGKGNHVRNARGIAPLVREAGIKLKINTTVTSLNWNEDMHQFIEEVRPDRWKVLQMLHIRGENDEYAKELSVTEQEFDYFVQNHSDVRLSGGIKPVFESCDAIESSYFMVTPSGNVKIDTGRKITLYPLEFIEHYGPEAIVMPEKYIGRGGVYEW